MPNNTKTLFTALSLTLSSSFGIAYGQTLTYPNCANPLVAGDFKKTILVDRVKDPTLEEPIKMAIANDGRVFFVERISDGIAGAHVSPFAPAFVKLYSPSTGAVTKIAELSVSISMKEMGITGIALDPNFESNGFLYLYFSPADNGKPTDKVFRISRFNFDGEKIQLSSEKILLSIPIQTDACCHTGGSMQFDGKGNLWVTIGNNTDNSSGYYVVENSKKATSSLDTLPIGDDQGHAANTNDLRGKILRIHPEADGSYSIPDNNLFPKELAGTRPEIYSMGHRNPYSLFVDKYPSWPLYAWGDVGPDEGGYTEELNLKTKPGFMGWPYFSGNTITNIGYKFASFAIALKNVPGLVAADYAKDPLNPINNSINNTGLKNLPPTQDATFGYPRSTAMTGPVYHYNGKSTSTIKFPPQFNKMWFMADHNKTWLKVSSVDSLGNVSAQIDISTIISFAAVDHPIDLEFGPDGALYVINYAGYFNSTANTKIIRIEYNGACADVDLLPPSLVSGIFKGSHKLITLGKNSLFSNLRAGSSIDLPSEAKGFSLYNMQGQKVWEYHRQDIIQKKVIVPEAVQKGVLQVMLL